MSNAAIRSHLVGDVKGGDEAHLAVVGVAQTRWHPRHDVRGVHVAPVGIIAEQCRDTKFDFSKQEIITSFARRPSYSRGKRQPLSATRFRIILADGRIPHMEERYQFEACGVPRRTHLCSDCCVCPSPPFRTCCRVGRCDAHTHKELSCSAGHSRTHRSFCTTILTALDPQLGGDELVVGIVGDRPNAQPLKCTSCSQSLLRILIWHTGINRKGSSQRDVAELVIKVVSVVIIPDARLAICQDAADARRHARV